MLLSVQRNAHLRLDVDTDRKTTFSFNYRINVHTFTKDLMENIA